MSQKNKNSQVMPLVSIIIPVYNGANFLREAIGSALAQTYPNIEILVVNDGSNDNQATEKIALSYGDQIRYFYKENGGVASALNYGIGVSRGEYFSWLSHDDMYYPNKIETEINALRAAGEPTRLAFCNYDFLGMDAGGALIPARFETSYRLDKLENGIYPILLGLVSGCALLVHMSHFRRVGLFREDLRTAQDVNMWFRLFRGQKTVFIPESLVQIRWHAEQGSRTIETFADERDRILIEHFDAATPEEIDDLFGGEFWYCLAMMHLFKSVELPIPYKHVLARFQKLVPPPEYSTTMEKVQERMRTFGNGKTRKVCIFGAGKLGIGLRLDLSIYGVDVDCFSDNNPDKWGKTINDLPCIKPEEIEPDKTLVIISPKNAAGIQEQLSSLGITHTVRATALTDILQRHTAHDVYAQ